jgi:hypothetical protein
MSKVKQAGVLGGFPAVAGASRGQWMASQQQWRGQADRRKARILLLLLRLLHCEREKSPVSASDVLSRAGALIVSSLFFVRTAAPSLTPQYSLLHAHTSLITHQSPLAHPLPHASTLDTSLACATPVGPAPANTPRHPLQRAKVGLLGPLTLRIRPVGHLRPSTPSSHLHTSFQL